MRNKIKKTDFNFEYSGSDWSEKEVVAKGFLQLSGKELFLRISNKTIFGDYIMGYKFATNIYQNGTAEGINDVGSEDFGNWSINFEENTLQLEWKKGWIDTVTHAYAVNETIEFYDIDTGKWRTTFKIFKALENK
jgi:hypothetical protein